MQQKEIDAHVSKLKNEGTYLLSNIYGLTARNEDEITVLKNDTAIVLFYPERFRTRVHFATNDLAGLKELATKVPSGSICEYIYREKAISEYIGNYL